MAVKFLLKYGAGMYNTLFNSTIGKLRNEFFQFAVIKTGFG